MNELIKTLFLTFIRFAGSVAVCTFLFFLHLCENFECYDRGRWYDR